MTTRAPGRPRTYRGRAVTLLRSRRHRLQCAAVLVSALVASCSSGSAEVALAMFSDPECTEPLMQDGKPFVVVMDTSQDCFAFTYVDRTGMVVPTSHANFTLSESGVSYDKYPFSATCQPSTIRSVAPESGHTVTTTCQFARSHGGGVYEKLVDYTHP